MLGETRLVFNDNDNGLGKVMILKLDKPYL